MEFRIKNRKGLKIVGDVLVPEKSVGLAFVLHGLGAHRKQPQIQTICSSFLKNNFTVVNIDATNSFNDSEGEYIDATMQAHYDDLCDVVEWSKMQSWYTSPFILVGSSLGGYAAGQYAEDNPVLVKAVVLKAAVVSGKFSHERTKKYNPEKLKSWKETGWLEEKSESIPGLIKRLPWAHMEERLNHDLLSGISSLTMPVLLIVGGGDISHIEDQRILYNLLPGPKELHIVKDAPHTFREEKHLNELKNILDNWIKGLN